MEITTTEIIITTSLAAIGFGFFIYNFYIVKTPITEIKQPITEIIEPITSVIEPAINHVVNHPVVVAPTTSEEMDLLLKIFNANPVYNEASNSLLKYREIFYNGEIFNDVLYNSPFINATPNEQINELYRRLENTKEWLNISQILRETTPSYELLEAIVNRDLEITFDPTDYAEQVTAIPLDQVTTVPLEQTIVPHNSFTDFITSEFGIKCMIAGSAIVVTAIIIHLLVVYYYKTTYTAIAYKCINWIPKLIKIIKGLSLK